MTSYHFFPVLFIRRDSLSPAHTQREESHKGVNARRQGSPGTTSGAECGRKCTNKAAVAGLCHVSLPSGRPAAETPPLSSHRSASGAVQELERAAEERGWYKATLISRWPPESAHCIAADPPEAKASLQDHMTPFWPLAKLFLLPELLFCVLFSPSLNHSLETRAGNPIHWALITYQASFTVMSQTFHLFSRYRLWVCD